MRDKMAISADILKIVENDTFLRLQMTGKEMLNRHQLFLKLVMIKNVKVVIIQAFKSKFQQYFVFTKNYSTDLSHFASAGFKSSLLSLLKLCSLYTGTSIRYNVNNGRGNRTLTGLDRSGVGLFTPYRSIFVLVWQKQLRLQSARVITITRVLSKSGADH